MCVVQVYGSHLWLFATWGGLWAFGFSLRSFPDLFVGALGFVFSLMSFPDLFVGALGLGVDVIEKVKHDQHDQHDRVYSLLLAAGVFSKPALR
jgi:hypothetical protein